MGLYNPFAGSALGGLLDTLLPDFMIGFAFFTSLCFAVFSRRFERQRAAVVMSAALGLALAVGLVWWEHEKGLSIRHLGPVAVGFALLMLGLIMYYSIRRVGGSWGGAGIAVGVSLLVAGVVGTDSRAASELAQSIAAVLLAVGILAFLLHMRGRTSRPGLLSAASGEELGAVYHDMTDLHKNRRVGEKLGEHLEHVRREAGQGGPHTVKTVTAQLRELLSCERWLIDRLAGLRKSAHRMRKGHVARIKELRHVMKVLPASEKRKASEELAMRYAELKLDERLEGLDREVTETAKRIRELNKKAQVALARDDHRELDWCLKRSVELSGETQRLLGRIEKTEKELITIARRVAGEASRRDDR